MSAGAAAFSRRDGILFAIFVGLTGWLLRPYEFGGDNHTALVMTIRRYADPDFLPFDFYLNAIERFTPRLFLGRALAHAASLVPLPALFFLLHGFAQVGLSLVTYLASRHFFPDARLGALVTPVLVMTTPLITLGSVELQYSGIPVPHSLAVPVALSGLMCVFTNRLVWALGWFLVAVFIHPQIGAECGVIAFSSYSLSCLLNRRLSLALQGGAACLILIVCVFALWMEHYGRTVHLPISQFVDILVRFRAPHHFMPSYFSGSQYFAAAAFAAIFVCFRSRWRKLDPALADTQRLADIMLLVLLGCLVAGYIFVEIKPIRFMVAAQVFRMVIIASWIGAIVIGGVIAAEIETIWVDNRAAAISLLLAAFALPALLWALLIRYTDRNSNSLVGSALAVCGVAAVLVVKPLRVADFLWFSYLVLVALFLALTFRETRRRRALGTLLVLTVLFGSPGIGIVSSLGLSKNVIRLEDHDSDTVNLGAAIRALTPQESIVLYPPFLGPVRLIAERASVVNYKSLPFSDLEMLEWKERIDRAYGPLPAHSSEMMWLAEANYRKMTDERLADLQRRYGVAYAVLHRDTPTNLPRLAQVGEYHVVQVAFK